MPGLPASLRRLVALVLLAWSILGASEQQVATGFQHTVHLAPDGTVWTWGGNSFGQLGHGDTTPRSTPTQVAGLTNIIAVSAGFYHTLALRGDGTVFAWGYNFYGQLGDGTTATRYAPEQITAIGGIVEIAAGGHHSTALERPGAKLYA